ncbi:hypothetical protein ACFQ08_17410 [Streptosporangium algeriense]|uniref:Uncharacterized protein n=1 Tax=Streptosporangium algeriense TaxID=1682748 RepID=A0ABW3DUC0_9ACTN
MAETGCDHAVRQTQAAARAKEEADQSRRNAEQMDRDVETENERKENDAWRQTFRHERRRAAAEQHVADQAERLGEMRQ